MLENLYLTIAEVFRFHLQANLLLQNQQDQIQAALLIQLLFD